MPPTLFAEIDLVQIIIVVIAMLGGFIQWLWNLIQQAKADAEKRREVPLSPEEKALREEAWRRQVMTDGQVRPSPKASPSPVNDPFASVRDVFEQVKKELAEAQKQTSPPSPRPERPSMVRPTPPQKTGSVRNEFTVPPKNDAPAPVAPVTVTGSMASAIPQGQAYAVTRATPDGTHSRRHAWQSLLGNPEALRDAFVLKEVLGAPKALQSVSDSS